MENNTDQVFLEATVKAIVANPDAVVVTRKVDEMGVLLSLKVDPADMGSVIGREGSIRESDQNTFEDCRRQTQRASQSED